MFTEAPLYRCTAQREITRGCYWAIRQKLLTYISDPGLVATSVLLPEDAIAPLNLQVLIFVSALLQFKSYPAGRKAK